MKQRNTCTSYSFLSILLLSICGVIVLRSFLYLFNATTEHENASVKDNTRINSTEAVWKYHITSTLMSSPLDDQIMILSGDYSLNVYDSASATNSSKIGVILPGAVVVLAASFTSSLNERVSRIHIIKPYNGWITTSFRYRLNPLNKSLLSLILKSQNVNAFLRCASSHFIATDLPGGDIEGGDSGPADADSPLSCCELCVRLERCKGWTFTSPTSSCWLKDKPGTYRNFKCS